ncbi:MAG: V-type ATP synthase subunit F [Candidatus Pacebacteria bacterium]|nr:V-type ATP synthase subunit F [Candidatus Paceibacterota bacterium]
MKIGIIGEKKSVLAFQALGIQTFGVSNESDLNITLQQIREGDFAVIFVTEDMMQKYGQEIELLMRGALPAVLVVPGVSGVGEKGRESLKRIMERALGSDTLVADP